MGTVKVVDTNLWGSSSNLDVKDMVSTISTKKGAKTHAKINIADGFHLELLMGDKDVEDFNREVHEPTPSPEVAKACTSPFIVKYVYLRIYMGFFHVMILYTYHYQQNFTQILI